MNFVLLIKAKDKRKLASKMKKLYVSGSGYCDEKYIELIDITKEEEDNYEKYKRISTESKMNFFEYVKDYDCKVLTECEYEQKSLSVLKSFYKIIIVNEKNKVLNVIKPKNPNGIIDGYKEASVGEGYFKMTDGRIIASNIKKIESMPQYDRHIPLINKLDMDDEDWSELFFNKSEFLYNETQQYYEKEAIIDFQHYKNLSISHNFKTIGEILKLNNIDYKVWSSLYFEERFKNEFYKKVWSEYVSQDFLKILREDYLKNELNHFIYMNPEVLKLWDMNKYVNYKKISTISCYKFFNKKVFSKPEINLKSEKEKLNSSYKWAKKIYNFINNKNEQLYILDCHK